MTRTFQTTLALLAVSMTLAASGQGTIVYNDPVDIPVFGLDPYIYNFDMNGDGVTDFQFRAMDGSFAVVPLGQNAALAVPASPPDFGGFASALQSGATIGNSPIIPTVWVQGTETQVDRVGPGFISCTTLGCLGYWQGVNTVAYLGTQFYIGSEIHYGWVHLRAFSNGGYIKEWAYDTVAGQGILAGAVPEPSTWVFCTLAVIFMTATKRFKRQ